MTVTESHLKPLDKQLRSILEATVKEARDVAEDAARASCNQLGVGRAKPDLHLTEDERDLRRKLRIHGRQLGDKRDSKSEEQELYRLVEEIAYEHWHRMLFARFLAENQLLMYPDPDEPVAVSLEDCEDLAADEGAANGWELAARFATKMLPQIFRIESPAFALDLPPEKQQRLEQLLSELPPEVFTASDSLGWVYQFWQTKRKKAINESEVKIGARELPAVTQLFTEPYMVSFLLDNSLGAWWAARRLSEDDLQNAESEQELRDKASLPDVPFEYLRFVRTSSGDEGEGEENTGPWTPAAGTFDAWPESLSELKTLDPCCGSGHFLVAALLMLTPMRMELEELSATEAVDAVLRDNLHGLEIDERCCQIAAFNVAMEAWKLAGYRELPELHIACSGIGPQCSEEEWLHLAEASGVPMPRGGREPIENGLLNLHQLFSQAPTLGSLIDPTSLPKDLIAADYETLRPYLTATLSAEQADVEVRERAVAAAGMVKAVELLAGDYTLVVTNVPYLGRGKQSDLLKSWAEKHEADAKADLATMLVSRSFGWLARGGSVAVVSPQNWLFLTTYKKLRERLLRDEQWDLVARLGPGAFETIGGHVVNVALLTLTQSGPADTHAMLGLDASPGRDADEKAALLRGELGQADQAAELRQLPQAGQRKNPDAVVSLDSLGSSTHLEEYARCAEGLSTGDKDRYLLSFWEIDERERKIWELFQSAPLDNQPFSDCHMVIRWEEGSGELVRSDGARVQGNAAWGKRSVLVGRITTQIAGFGLGCKHDKMAVALVPRTEDVLPAVWSCCSSFTFHENLRKITQRLDAATGSMVKVPFDLAHWQAVAAEKYPEGLPEPESDDPTQWLFHGRPEASEQPLQVAVARLLGYRWPAELDAEMRLSERARTLVATCGELAKLADKDGIVCLPAVRGEAPAADRLLGMLAAAFGAAWSGEKLRQLLAAVDHAEKPLQSWLRDKFFTQHCKLFHHRPFVWHVWDGLKDGFSALVNYHKLDKKLLETLIYTYLNDWITQQQNQLGKVDGSQERLDAASALKAKLELILKGESPHDIFVRWKPLEEQPLGWDPDLNDGVRLNIRPWLTVGDVGKKGGGKKGGGKKGAGILRDKPNLHWKKDRGKDVESAPWHHLGPQYGGKEGDRINDHHLTLAEKTAARTKGNA
ncbi:Eco57I restriction-modification methylase domain-containing protein [Botrimarina hoheduenensis]|uniref:site-specific DNA-methyltransferase (adenine-specific) n=1 Tax=Botrimarina hoheduenensis TaxID=2528000 RepID=A0A5C5WFQ5_9BACT|nr:DNA methyltransferase [Botrimarina hoheduenensis]TWT48941.1 N-6 DNA Methylase [Botrimarina hoheduenensis]